jgi:hypothetical protein
MRATIVTLTTGVFRVCVEVRTKRQLQPLACSYSWQHRTHAALSVTLHHFLSWISHQVYINYELTSGVTWEDGWLPPLKPESNFRCTQCTSSAMCTPAHNNTYSTRSVHSELGHRNNPAHRYFAARVTHRSARVDAFDVVPHLQQKSEPGSSSTWYLYFSSYLTENRPRLHYTEQLTNAVQGNSPYCENHTKHIVTCIHIARQRLGKHASTTDRLLSIWSALRPMLCNGEVNARKTMWENRRRRFPWGPCNMAIKKN